MSEPARILLVDDQPEMELLVRRMVRRSGHELAARGDVPSAWAYLSEGRADLVLLDINLPGASGLELCRRLCGPAGGRPRPAVAVFSQWDRAEEIEAALLAGADFVLAKDLVARPEEWQRRLAEILACLPPVGPLPGRAPPLSLCSQQPAAGLSAEEVAAALESALRLLPLQPVRPALVLLLARRGLARAGDSRPPGSAPPRPASPAALRRLARRSRPEALLAFVVALTEQLRFVFGTAVAAPFEAALTRALA